MKRWLLNIRFLCLGLFPVALVLLFSSKQAYATSLELLRSSVFKIIVVSNEPSFSEPWKRLPSSTATGTGFYIGGDRIMTNAHVVANGSYISILRDGDAKPVPAYVEYVAHDADLAVIVPREKGFLKKLTPLYFGSLPKLRSPVATIGFPTGGEQISITEGIVSRISYRRYVHDGRSRHLLVQVDSAINPGNSGGPVVQGRRVVGVAFQSYTSAENTGYIIPTPVINRFLKDIEDGHYDGHQDDGMVTMDWSLMNPSTAIFHGIDPTNPNGVTVTNVADYVPASGHIRAGDVLTSIDGIPIGVDGKITFQGERVDFRTIYDLKQLNESVVFELVRDGKELKEGFKLTPVKPHHNSYYVYNKNARYYVFGGLVFTTLSRSYLRTWGDKWYREAPFLLRYLDAFAPIAEDFKDFTEFVVYSKRLPDLVNQYSDGNRYGVIEKVDGKPVRSLQDLIAAVEGATKRFLVLEFFDSHEPIVLDLELAKSRNSTILSKYGVNPDRYIGSPHEDGAVSKEDLP